MDSTHLFHFVVEYSVTVPGWLVGAILTLFLGTFAKL